MAQKMPIRIRKHVAAANVVFEFIRTDRVPSDEMWCLQHIAYENETGARGTFRRFIEGLGYNHYLAELAAPGLGELIFTEVEQWLLPGECLTIRQATCVAGDRLSLYVDGYAVHSKFIPPEE